MLLALAVRQLGPHDGVYRLQLLGRGLDGDPEFFRGQFGGHGFRFQLRDLALAVGQVLLFNYLAHKGGLGGGRGGTVTIDDFWKLFSEPKLKTVTWEEDGSQKRLQHFVGEAERIRELARSGQLKKALRSTNPT